MRQTKDVEKERAGKNNEGEPIIVEDFIKQEPHANATTTHNITTPAGIRTYTYSKAHRNPSDAHG